MEKENLPIPLKNWLKAGQEGRLVIAKPKTGLEHRQFSLTLRPKQILVAFKACLKGGEYPDSDEEELVKLYKILVDTLLRKNPALVEVLYRHFRGRLEAHYNARIKERRVK